MQLIQTRQSLVKGSNKVGGQWSPLVLRENSSMSNRLIYACRRPNVMPNPFRETEILIEFFTSFIGKEYWSICVGI